MGAMLSSPMVSKIVERRSCKFANTAMSTMQGWRISHEDAHVMDIDLDGEACVFAVLDGHGGQQVALDAARFLSIGIRKEWAALSDKFDVSAIKNMLKTMFLSVDVELRNKLGEEAMSVGSTCVLALVVPHAGQQLFDIYFSNLGDSRALAISNQEVKLATFDHKPCNEVEKNRIEKAGGWVSTNDPSRVDDKLAVSRAFGDFEYKCNTKVDTVSQKVSPEPDLYHTQLVNGDSLILACDGIFDVMDNDTVRKYFATAQADVANQPDLGDTCASLLAECLALLSRDNMTVIAVDFGPTECCASSVELKTGDVDIQDEDMIRRYDQFARSHGFDSGRPKHGCNTCGRYMSCMQQCPCKAASYCSRKCQKLAWKEHRKNCSEATKKKEKKRDGFTA